MQWPLQQHLNDPHCQDPDTKSSLLQSNRSTTHYPSFILGFIFYYPPYYSLLTSFLSIPVHLLISPSYQHCYTWIIKYQLWLHTDFIGLLALALITPKSGAWAMLWQVLQILFINSPHPSLDSIHTSARVYILPTEVKALWSPIHHVSWCALSWNFYL